MSFQREGFTCLEGLFGSQADEKIDLKVCVFLSSYGLAVLFALSEHTEPSALIPGEAGCWESITKQGLKWSLLAPEL